MAQETAFGKQRLETKHYVPNSLENLDNIVLKTGDKTESVNNNERISKLFQNTYGQPIVDITPKSLQNNSDEKKDCKIANDDQSVNTTVVTHKTVL